MIETMDLWVGWAGLGWAVFLIKKINPAQIKPLAYPLNPSNPFFWFDDSNLHYTHAHTVWGGQRGFESLPNGGEFSLAPLGQMPSGQNPSNPNPSTQQ